MTSSHNVLKTLQGFPDVRLKLTRYMQEMCACSLALPPIISLLELGERFFWLAASILTWRPKEVYFHTIPDEIIEKLIEEGTVLYVAGGLIKEHPLILPFIKQVVGTIDSVMGLPKALIEKLIKDAL
ncbi:hypothetical protein CMV_005389 [Castanea mollissima]|uniref:Maf-like protein n=1 Tax=Castanea mollissima TaxID=60419 RepID=A0A8J4RLJ8_9ROSI|nr:hypothetical protein CMV_005389 [Castanea mollissima]